MTIADISAYNPLGSKSGYVRLGGHSRVHDIITLGSSTLECLGLDCHETLIEYGRHQAEGISNDNGRVEVLNMLECASASDDLKPVI